MSKTKLTRTKALVFDRITQRSKEEGMENLFETRGDDTAIFIQSPKYGGFETLISTNKLQMVSDEVDFWFVTYNKTTKNFYVNGNPKNAKSKGSISLHRLIMGIPKSKCVDHINHNTLDNRDSNLRTLTNQENQQNRKGAQANSSSGIRGVYWHKGSGKWNVQLKLNGKKKSYGLYSDLRVAELVAIDARKKNMPYSS